MKNKIALAVRRPLSPVWSRMSYTVLAVAVCVSLGLGVLKERMDRDTLLYEQETEEFVEPDRAATAKYLSRLDVREFERNGADYVNPKFSPSRIGVPLERLDVVFDYDFHAVAEVERRLKGVDRKKVLRRIYEVVTQDARTLTEAHMALLKFVHKSSFHNLIQPMYPNGRMVTDPLVLLTLGEMACGHVSRLAVDLFEAGRIKGRLVQMGGHVIAEAFYEGKWHYFDGDLFGNGETVVLEDGTIPSVVELSEMPYLVDALPGERNAAVLNLGSIPYASWTYFSKDAYGLGRGIPVYYEKSADERQKLNRYYGWNYIRMVPDRARKLYAIDRFYRPGAVMFTRIEKDSHADQTRRLHLEWSESIDLDGDVVGYKVFVSRKPRGWSYGRYSAPENFKEFFKYSKSWQPEMYESLYQIPPHEVGLLITKEPAADLSLRPGGTYFISVMPFDTHGETVGKVVYQMSDEIRVSM